MTAVNSSIQQRIDGPNDPAFLRLDPVKTVDFLPLHPCHRGALIARAASQDVTHRVVLSPFHIPCPAARVPLELKHRRNRYI